MLEKEFSERLRNLRIHKNVSARDMSLSIGQNPSYINRIENDVMVPSMSVFFFICDYLGVTPSEFFNIAAARPQRLRDIVQRLEKLNIKKFDDVANIIEDLTD